MSIIDGSGKTEETNPPTRQDNIGGTPGKESHGGDIAPPNSDDAGRRLGPESGPPDRA